MGLGCTARENNAEKVWNITVSQPASPVKVQQYSTPVPPSGYGLANGKIEVIASGGNGPYAYEWKKENVVQSGLSTNMCATLSHGTYTITARDSRYNNVWPATTVNRAGCMASVTIGLQQPSPLTVSVTQVDSVSCYGNKDAALQAEGTGGVTPYRWQWQYLDGTVWRNLSASEQLTDIGTGSYRVEIKDKNDNRALSPVFTVNQPSPLTVGLTTVMPTCHGYMDGQVKAVVAGGTAGYSYSWMARPETASSVTVGKGNYTVRVTDRNGCQAGASAVVTEPEPLGAVYQVILPSRHNASDGEIRITPSGGTPGYSYQWDYQSAVSNPLKGIAADSVPYHVTVRDAHQCSIDLWPRVIYPLDAEIVVRDSISCSGIADGHLEALAVGGVSRNYWYEWFRLELDGTRTSVGTGKVSPALPAGHYRVRVTDSEGSADSASFLFYEPDVLTLELQPRHLLCKYDADGELNAVVTGGTLPYQYIWSTGEIAPQIGGLEEGHYRLVVKDRRGCTLEDTLSILAPDEVSVSLDYIPPRAYHYSDASVWVTASGGVQPYAYAWTSREETEARMDSVTAGFYEAVVTDRNGCRKTISVEIPDPPLLEAFISQTRVVSCRGRHDARLEATASGGVGTVYEYQWYKQTEGEEEEGIKGAVADSLPAGIYRVKVTDENRIDAWSDRFEVIQPDSLLVRTSAAAIACNGDTDGWVEAAVTGGTVPYRYLWTSGDTTPRAEGLTDGAYMVFVKDARDCRAESLTEITVPDGLVITARVEHPVCNGDDNGNITLEVEGGAKPYRIEWEKGGEGENCRRLPAGTYLVVVTDAHGCFRRNEYVLTDPPKITADIGPDRTLCQGQWCELKRSGAVEAAVYRWFRDDRLIASGAVVKAEKAGIYRLEVEDEAGCMAVDEAVIHRNDIEIDANFAVAGEVETGEVVKLINTSYPEPDTVEWLLPESPEVMVLSNNPIQAEVVLNREGTYLFGIRSVVGSCEAVLYKQVEAHPADKTSPVSRVKEPMIREALLWPNPSEGHFRVRVRLREAAKGMIRMYSVAGILLKEQRYEGSDFYEWEYQEDFPAGVYILQVICGRERETLRWIMK